MATKMKARRVKNSSKTAYRFKATVTSGSKGPKKKKGKKPGKGGKKPGK